MAVSMLNQIHIQLQKLSYYANKKHESLISEVVRLMSELYQLSTQILALYNQQCAKANRLTTTGTPLGKSLRKEVVIYKPGEFARHIREAMSLGYISNYIEGWSRLLAVIQVATGDFLLAGSYRVYMAEPKAYTSQTAGAKKPRKQ